MIGGIQRIRLAGGDKLIQLSGGTMNVDGFEVVTRNFWLFITVSHSCSTDIGGLVSIVEFVYIFQIFIARLRSGNIIGAVYVPRLDFKRVASVGFAFLNG